TINRILGMFEQEEQAQVRNRLVDTIRWIVCQRLLPKVGGGRVAAFEIMGMNLRVRELIMNGETEDKTYYDIIADAKALGWQTFDQHILELYEDGLITEETAASYCTRKTAVNRGLDSIKSARGESTTGITGLAMDVKQEEKRRSGF
ncbi:MAG: twitching motility protein, partial [Deltaproteobacteria bacterium HGW-Deltaproteobacteria-16]